MSAMVLPSSLLSAFITCSFQMRRFALFVSGREPRSDRTALTDRYVFRVFE